jgi:hypothetical protein
MHTLPEVFDNPLDDHVQAVCDAVRALRQLSPDVENLVYADFITFLARLRPGMP